MNGDHEQRDGRGLRCVRRLAYPAYTATRYTDFPPRNKKWLYTPIGGAEGMIVWQQLGYLKLRKSRVPTARRDTESRIRDCHSH